MTSSERNWRGSRWDYEAPRYKDNRDVFCEPGLFSMLVLAHGRPNVTRRSILSTLDCTNLYEGEIEWVFVENGDCDENYEFFMELPVERKVVIRQKNYGINEGLNQAWGLSRGEYAMIHENDWQVVKFCDYLGISKSILDYKSEVGVVQLRDPIDPNENHGRGKPEYNPWSCTEDQNKKAGVKLWKEETPDGWSFLMSEFPNGFNNNPCIIRKSLYRECGPYPEPEVGSDPRHGETEYQRRVEKTGCAIALAGPIYQHIGKVQTRGI